MATSPLFLHRIPPLPTAQPPPPPCCCSHPDDSVENPRPNLFELTRVIRESLNRLESCENQCLPQKRFTDALSCPWNYTGLVDAIHNGEGKCWTTKVRTEDELTKAIATATREHKDSLCFKFLCTRMIQAKSCLSGDPEFLLLTAIHQIRNNTTKVYGVHNYESDN